MFTRFFYQLLGLLLIIFILCVGVVKVVEYYVTRANMVVVLVGEEGVFKGKRDCVKIEDMADKTKRVTIYSGFLCLERDTTFDSKNVELVDISDLPKD